MLDLKNLDKKEMLGCSYSRKLLKKLCTINKYSVRGLGLVENDQIDIAEVEKGIIYAKYYHGDQKRRSGEPYYSHPLEVAFMIADELPRTDIIVTAILHDTIEDTALTKKEIIEVFGEKVAEQVYDLTRIKENGVKISSALMIQDLWIQKKYDILLVKLFDRLHNMQTISGQSIEKRQKIIEETAINFLIAAAESGNYVLEEEIYKLCLRASSKEEEVFKNLCKDYSY